MSRRSIVLALGLALILILLPATLAGADYRGTDMWSNLAPPDGAGGLANKYPLSYYQLDYYVDGPSVGFSGVSAGDIPGLVGQFLISIGFAGLTFLMRVTISAFDWAFNIDVIGGRNGALRPVGQATQHLWFSTFAPLLTTGALLLGGWFVFKIIGRRFGEAGAGLIRAVCLAAAALVIIFNPGATVGKATSLTNDLAGAVVSGTTGGNGGQSVSDRMFETFIYKPWTVLEFGGLKRCTSVEKDADGFPRYVNGESSHNVCRNTMHQQPSGYGGYADHFLAYAPGSDARKHLYEGIRDGKEPDNPVVAGWKVDKADAPAADLMQGAGTVQRMGYFLLLAIGMLGAIAFLGLICFASLFAQLGLLVMLVATPFVAIASIFPGLHGVFFTWAKWGGKFLIAKVMYAVILSAALGVSAGLVALGGQKGYLFVLFLNALLFFGVIVCRKAILAPTMSRRDYRQTEGSAKSFVAGAATAAVAAVAAPAAAAAAAGKAGKARLDSIQQQHAAKPDTQQTADQPSSGDKPRPDSTSPPASAGREYSPAPAENGSEPAPASPSTAVASMPRDEKTPETQARGEEPVPSKSFQEDYEKARVEHGKQPDPAPAPKSPVNGVSPVTSFHEALEQERAKTPNT